MALAGRGFEEAQESNVHFDFLGQGQLWWGWAGVHKWVQRCREGGGWHRVNCFQVELKGAAAFPMGAWGWGGGTAPFIKAKPVTDLRRRNGRWNPRGQRRKWVPGGEDRGKGLLCRQTPTPAPQSGQEVKGSGRQRRRLIKYLPLWVEIMMTE